MKHLPRATSVALFLATACGQGTTPTPQQTTLALQVPQDTISLQVWQTRELELLVVGAGESEVTFSASDRLPAFASLQGSRLALSPGRGDAGDYTFDVVATAGSQTATATLHVAVADVPFAIVAPRDPIALQAGQTSAVQLETVGAGPNEVTFSASGPLPAFASLQGSVLTLSPGRGDGGDHAVKIVAAAGGVTASSTFHVTVAVPNSAPGFGSGLFEDVLFGDDAGIEMPWDTRPIRAFSGTPSIYVRLCDADDDSVTVDIETAALGQPFTGSATASVAGPVHQLQSERCATGTESCGCAEVKLPGLQAGGSYAFAVRITDALGARAATPSGADALGDGWVGSSRYWKFNLAP